MTAVELQMLADSTGGHLIGQSVTLQGLAIDSRAVKGGELFAAIRGARVDGHEFAAKAMSSGAAALLTERRLEGLTPQLVVSDVTSASGTFALLKRRSFAGPVIAITGSAGKTTTKNLVSAMLPLRFPVLTGTHESASAQPCCARVTNVEEVAQRRGAGAARELR